MDFRAEFADQLRNLRFLATQDPDGVGDATKKIDALTAFVETCQRARESATRDLDFEELVKTCELRWYCISV